MRRYLLLYLSAVFVFCVFLLSGILWMKEADQKTEIPFDTQITVYTTRPQEELSLLATKYQQRYRVKVNITSLTDEELEAKLNTQSQNIDADVILASSNTLERLAKKDLFLPLTGDTFDLVPSVLKSNTSQWVSVWYDPFVIGLNRDFMMKLSPVPDSWDDIVRPSELRVVVTDFLMADASAHFFLSFMKQNGQLATYDWLERLHPNIVSYAKYLSTPSRTIGIGEADAAITLQSEAIRYIHDGFPIAIVVPSEGTPYLATGCAVMRSSLLTDEAEAFARWLLSEEVQMILTEQRYYFVPANPSLPSYQSFTYPTENLWNSNPFLPEKSKYKLLDKWVQEIRIAK